MRQALFGGMAVIFGLIMTASVQAKGAHGSGGHSGGSSRGSYAASRTAYNSPHATTHRTTASRLENRGRAAHSYKEGKSGRGHVYKGRDHHHWKYRSWSHRYHCRCYWDEGGSCWYYWCDSDDCYYPMSCADSYPPTAEDEEDE